MPDQAPITEKKVTKEVILLNADGSASKIKIYPDTVVELVVTGKAGPVATALGIPRAPQKPSKHDPKDHTKIKFGSTIYWIPSYALGPV